MIAPYSYYNPVFRKKLSEIGGFENVDDILIYSDNKGHIYLLIGNDEFGWMACYSINDQDFVIDENIEQKLHPATRKEIKAAGFWDYVINKEDYSSEEDKIETELDEYLLIGEELSEARETEEK